MSGASAAATRAAAFLDTHGDPLTRAVAAALTGEAGVGESLSALPDVDALEGDDRLVPPLEICADLRALHAPFVRLAAARLERRQAEDGGFEGVDLPARLRISGMLGGFLARSPYVRPRTLDAIGDFLALHWSPDWVQSGVWANIAGYAHYFANAPHEAGDEILQWCGRELERGFRTRAFRAVETVRVLALCDAHAIPGATLSLDELVVGLLTEQDAEGAFGPAEAPLSVRLEHTRAGLVGLRRLAA